MATLSEAWEFAERTAFNRLRDSLNAEENRDAWLGEMPELMINAWEFSSGGTSIEPHGALSKSRRLPETWREDLRILKRNRQPARRGRGALVAA